MPNNESLGNLVQVESLSLSDLFLVAQGGNTMKATGDHVAKLVNLLGDHVVANALTGFSGKVTFKIISSLSSLNGNSVSIIEMLPANSIIFGVRVLNRSAITGTMTSYQVGTVGNLGRFVSGMPKTSLLKRIGLVTPFSSGDSPGSIILTATGGTGSGNNQNIEIGVFALQFE